jgi:two-component system sensor histidine kinase KdpD
MFEPNNRPEAETSVRRARAEPERRARRLDWIGCASATLLVVAATATGVLARPHLSPEDLVMVFLLIIMVVAFRFGRFPSLVAAALSVAAYDFFFVPPFYTFSVQDVRHVLTFAMMFAVGIIISSLTLRLRRQEQLARRRERVTAALYALTRDLATAPNEQRAAEVAAKHAADAFGGAVLVLLRRADGNLSVGGTSGAVSRLTEEEMGVARWVADHGRAAGRGTDTLPGARITCVPLQAGPTALGALAMVRGAPEVFDPEHRGFLDAFVRQAALSIERSRLSEAARAAALRAQTEEMRSALLSGVSHDLRTPLAAITGAGTALRDDRGKLGPAQRAELFDTICAEAERMERLIGNILDMVRLESGGIVPRREWVPLEEIVGSALLRLEARLGARDVRVDLPEDLPLFFVDPVIFEQVFVNLIDNAIKHAGPGSPIEIRATASEDRLDIDVADRGPGLPDGAEARVFDKFYRGPGARGTGVGLGLPICLGIVRAHGGSLTAQNRDGGGACFRIQLPRTEVPPSVGPIEEGVRSGEVRER